MANSKECYICGNKLPDSEHSVEIIIHMKAKTFWQSFKRLFLLRADEFVCMDCLSKGIIFQKELRLK